MAKKKDLHAGDTPAVEAYLAKLEHPFKAEAQAVREAILGVDPAITEQVKWNAPSFSYGSDYLGTFNLRPTHHLHLIFHHRQIAGLSSNILEGDYADRRMVYFSDMEDVRAKEAELIRVVRELIRFADQKTSRE